VNFVAAVLAVSVLVYFVGGLAYTFYHPEALTVERGRWWNELVGVLIGGLLTYIAGFRNK